MEAYALTDAAYVGQSVVYVDTANNRVYHYGIELDGTLKEIGSSPVGDEKTIEVDADGTVSLAGIEGLPFTEETEDGETAQITYQPLLTDAGLTWVRPSTTTVEGLSAEIEALKQNTYTKTQTEAAIAAAVSSAGHLKRAVVEELPEIVEGGEEPDADTIYMVKDETVTEGDAYNEYMYIDGAFVQIGSTSVDLSNYVQWKEAGDGENVNAYALTAKDEDGKLVATGMTVQNILAHTGNSEVHITADERIAWNAMGTALENKVDKAEGYRLMSDAEGTKLANLKETITTEDVNGLADLLNGKVDKEEGKGLSTNDFTDELAAKLAGIAEGAQVNTIEMVQVAGVNQTISEKVVNIVMATGDNAGVVKGTDAQNGVAIAEDGTMSVNSVSVDKLVQSEDEVLILNGGAAQ